MLAELVKKFLQDCFIMSFLLSIVVSDIFAHIYIARHNWLLPPASVFVYLFISLSVRS